ncbi:hypothetical protein K435DRAFT_858404 [Dendrothele bispora CBS 962.96]|uniref:KOW domain-containing protein n=1 Tax=Dendrothele bispora (strain CBS 962.96) TaxID=1314807 RepID=A0A4S8M4A1_DENBC|nr:hypothetical protein K435DRAFT_858404 [Dendrothele bispora CBS 962.96]
MANPFIDDQAWVNDEDEYEDDEELGHGSNGGEDEDPLYDDEDWNDENDPRVHQDDSLGIQSTPHARVDAITEQLVARYVGHDHEKTSPDKSTDSPTPSRSHSDTFQSLAQDIDIDINIDDTILKSVLYSKEKQIFWRLKCKPGSEMDLVFEVMQLTNPARPSVPPPHTQHPSPSPAARALLLIRQYALTQEGEPKSVADELEILLAAEWSMEWTRLVDAAGLEPGEDDVQAALANVNEKAKAFLPVSVLEEAERVTASSSRESDSVSQHPLVEAVRPPPLLSVFCAPTVHGFVYLEGRCDAIWLHWFTRNSKVVKTRNSKLWIEPVDCEEIGLLLNTPIPSIQPFSWVQVKRGLYRDDVGLTLSTEMRGGQRHFKVLLVPRLFSGSSGSHDSVKGKRKWVCERPAQRLFHPNSCDGGCVKIAEGVYRSGSTEYRHGLVIKYYDSSSLSQSEVLMDRPTRRFFGLSGDPVLKKIHLPVSEDWLFYPEEEVIAVVGAPLTERQILNTDLPRATYRKDGMIVNVGQGYCMVQFNDYENFDSEDTSTRISMLNLRKKMGVGDSVEVVSGELKGRQGLVISRSFDTVEVKESMGSDCFEVSINTCRITARRNFSVVPWIGRHVVAVLGQYRGYSGIIVDVQPPDPHYTMLEVKLAKLGVLARIPHDFAFDTISNHWLRFVCPLNESQQHFRQPAWDVYRVPNLASPPVDPYTGRFIVPEDLTTRQPEQPWLNSPVMVVKGPTKNTGRIREVERSHHNASGLRVKVEFDFFSAEHGAVPQSWCDYAAVRDPRTGLPLHIVYPLRKRERYWEPLTPIKAVSVKNPYYATQQSQRPLVAPSTPLWHTEVTDIFSTPDAGPSHSGHEEISGPPPHWAIDLRLDQKSFFACWKPRSGTGLAKVTATPHHRSGIVQITDGATGWFVPPDEIQDLAIGIKPTTNKNPLLVVRGPHAGVNIRQVFCKYVRGHEEPLIIGAIYNNWGTSAEKYTGEDIEVETSDCALAASDPNRDKFKAEITALRNKAREPQEGKKTRRRAIKPRGP